ncbi:Hypothetical protein FKW44_016302 [Caligus rogercresseyi]|uniref:Uncharacterized protein n=1 Tax=Caligus rogercresseyi TaxID=217165 RepID=A0A7T8H1W2_CALRO|nr:Hypothetical protein FKW44_016302 [Caligus rogercresseyi]
MVAKNAPTKDATPDKTSASACAALFGHRIPVEGVINAGSSPGMFTGWTKSARHTSRRSRQKSSAPRRWWHQGQGEVMGIQDRHAVRRAKPRKRADDGAQKQPQTARNRVKGDSATPKPSARF